MKNFDHILPHVDDYLHNLLSRREAEYVEEHCAKCRICETALEEARKRQKALATVPPSEASEGLIQSTLSAIDRQIQRDDKRRHTWRKVLWTAGSAAAAAVLLLVGMGWYYASLTPSPYDLTLLGQDRLLAGTQASLRVRLTDRDRAEPIAHAPVAVQIMNPVTEQFVSLVEFETDEQGTGNPRFALPDWPDGDYTLKVSARTPGGPEVLTQPIRLQRSWSLMLSTDKPVYQPNQTIHMRSLALRRPDLKPVAGQEAVFRVTDPKGNVIFKQTGLTSKFGISWADCPLADELIEGPYAIACKIGDSESQRTVEVKRYVLPKFKIDVTGLEPYYRPGQRAKGTVQVAYFFGQPVVDAEVAIRLRSDALASRGREAPEEAPTRTLKTDAAGKATFDILLPDRLVGRPKDGGDARVFFDIAVMDTAGQKQSRSVSRIVTTQELKIEVIPEAGALVKDQDNTIHVFVSYPDGRPASKARLAVSGVEEEIAVNELGVASFAYRPGGDQLVSLTFRATDEKGRSSQRTIELQVGRLPNDFLVRTDKATYAGGDKMTITALGAGVEPVFVDLIKDGQTMLTQVIDMKNTKSAFQFDIPPDLFGTVELVAYRFNAEGLPVRKSRVIYIRPADQLAIHATPDKKEYRPGESAKVLFRITDADGKPVPAALSLSAVDEAVYAVLDQAPGMEKVFYLLERKLLEPVYAIYDWAPDLDTAIAPAERDRFEQALFARTATVSAVEPQVISERMPGQVRTTARTVASPHSVTSSSFPIKATAAQSRQHDGLSRVRTGWTILFSLLGLAGLVQAGRWAHDSGVIGSIQDSFTNQEGGVSIWAWVLGSGLFAIVLLLVLVETMGTKREASFAMVGAALDRSEMAMEVVPKSADFPKWEAKKEERAPEPTSTASPAPRVREWFPETLLWRPELITDDQGRVTLPLELADSITTWRLSASAVSADGRLGATRQDVLVFQPFFVDLNLPVALTRNDEVAVPVIVHNHLDKAQTVSLKLAGAAWFDLLEDADRMVELKPHEVKAVHYRLKVKQVGRHNLEVTALASGVSDAIKKEIEVISDGRRVEQVASGSLDRPYNQRIDLPANAIEGSPRLFVKLYPSVFSQLVEGLDAIFQMPSGCFEQTSSTTYPNILALDYLRRTKKSVPEVEAKARQYIHVGYQRLLSFEVSGGGFDWYGRPPANVRLTAYGLMEFRDMAKVHDVDPQLIARTQRWLMSRLRGDGSWPVADDLHQEANPARGQRGDIATHAMTAYVGWAVFSGQPEGGEATRAYLLRMKPEQINDPYVLALTANALLAIDPKGGSANAYIDRLEAIKKSSADGKAAWWELGGDRTAFYGSGQSGNVEATALAALAFIESKRHPAATRAALTWISQQKDARGTWHSTQATVLALKALLAGTGASLGEETDRQVEITLGDLKRTVRIPKSQADVVQHIDLSASLGGGQDLQVRETTQGGTVYQVVYRYHVPEEQQPKKSDGPLAIEMTYDKSELAVNDRLNVTARVVNRTDVEAPMIILDLPVPAGFAVDGDDFRKLVEEKKIDKFQVTARKVIVYLRGLQPGQGLALDYSLRATMPVKVQVQSARAYEYYNPARQGVSAMGRLEVRPQ